MSLKSINEDANIILASFIQWFSCIRQPQLTYQAILDSVSTEEEKFKVAFQLWLATTCLNIVFLLPVFNFVGIKLSNLNFYIPVLLVWLSFLMFPALFIHLAFRLYKISSKLPETLVLYTISVYCYTPFLTIIGEPWSVYSIELFEKAKLQQSGFIDALIMFKTLYDELLSESNGFRIYMTLRALASFLIIFYCLINFQRMATNFYQIEKSKVILAMGFALGGLQIIPIYIVWYFYFFIIYSAL